MKRLLLSTVLIIAANLASIALGDSTAWKVRSYLDGPPDFCRNARVELLLQSSAGEILGRHDVVFADGLRDDEWPLPAQLGSLILEVYRVDCGGIRARMAQLNTELTASTRGKQVYVAAVVEGDALDPRFVEIDTYSDAEGRVSARRHEATLLLTNPGPDSVMLCQQSSVASVRDEYSVQGEWTPSDSPGWGIPRDVAVIEPRGELALRPTVIKYVPPSDAQPVIPEAARVMLAIKPAGAIHVALGEVPRAFLGFRGCDFLYVPREVTQWDRIWPRADVEP